VVAHRGLEDGLGNLDLVDELLISGRVTAANLELINPTELRFDATVRDDAPLGSRDLALGTAGLFATFTAALTVDPARAGSTRDGLLAALAAERIEARPTWKPMHAQPLFAGSRMYAHDPALPPVCNRLFAEGICLPSGSSMGDAEIARVVRVARAALGQRRLEAKILKSPLYSGFI
jgi:hypothetical protein